jgi:hypothetical protein
LPKPHNNLIKQNGHNVKLFLIMIELEWEPENYSWHMLYY